MIRRYFGAVRQGAFATTLLTSVLAIALASGCRSGDRSNGAASGSSRADIGGMPDRQTPVIRDADRSHVIGPTAAAELNYRVAWQYLNAGRNVKHFLVQGDSVYVLDGENFLTRIRIEDGNRHWRMQVADPIEQVLGITLAHERIYVTTGGAMLVLDLPTGSQIGKQPLHSIASTQPVVYGQYLIYGSRNGQIVWHSGLVGQHWRSYQIANAVHVPPQLRDQFVVGTGNDGTVISLNAGTTNQYWSKKLLAPVVCAPDLGETAVYVAGQDQYLWAIDIDSGRTLWKVLTQSPLSESPTLIDDRVYQSIGAHGLHCFEALPFDRPGGVKVWSSTAATGNVIMKRRSDLFVWDAKAKRITLLDMTRGSLIKTVELPQVSRLFSTSRDSGDVFALSADGRVVRLVPRN